MVGVEGFPPNCGLGWAQDHSAGPFVTALPTHADDSCQW